LSACRITAAPRAAAATAWWSSASASTISLPPGARAVARPYQAGHAPAGIAERFGGDVSESAGRSDNEDPLSHRRRAALPR